jgi:hypothetical protein
MQLIITPKTGVVLVLRVFITEPKPYILPVVATEIQILRQMALVALFAHYK